ncbi:response regulator transcription factor [Cellulomonas sp. SLBN-39]|uniref:response regulator n=1 Tax=Cellulomonas sp. SLBN-39 TaxID=2768446 RepID=UPI0011519C21|nr:response regulator transcription factor [Cellulomonas sp. SLBN-39]TQL02816.1 LuxR family two component transcriptional regulator [Cellulomonas sp. SLBN-39]
MTRVVLVDDQAVVRAGFRVLIEEHPDLEVVGEASSGPDAVAVVRRTHPDVVCMDVRMPGGDGLAATRQIVADRGEADLPAVLVVTTFDLDEYVFGALEAGASGFVLKDCDPDELADAIRALARGEATVDRSVTRRVLVEFARRRPAPTPDDAGSVLTPRETDIVRLLAQGMSNAEIAAALVVEPSTVKSHLGRAMTKLGTRDRLQTVVWAYRTGLARP